MIIRTVQGCSVFNRPTIFTMIPTIVCMGLAAFLISGCGKEKAATQAPVVEVADVVQKDVPIFAEWVGTLDGMVNATIRAQVQGYLVKQNYKEGDLVKKDQVLFEIDARTFQAALDQAKGELARTEARFQQTKANLTRIRPLAAQNAVSQKDLDDAIAAEQSAQACSPVRKGCIRQGGPGPWLYKGNISYRRHCRYCPGTGRKPRWSWTGGATNNGFYSQPYQGLCVSK